MDDLALAATCARCGTRFQCGVDAPAGCWCARLPLLPATATAADRGCLCEACLQELLDRRTVVRAAPPRR